MKLLPPMADILSAQFADFESARATEIDLRALGIAAADMEVFALNAPGQHGRFPIGGDEDADRGARGGESGAVAGAALGGAAGLVLGAIAAPVAGPIAPAVGVAVGAYTGSLAGAVKQMPGHEPASQVAARPAGVRLAVHVATPANRQPILASFRRNRAISVEEADGTWEAGAWTDFDPVSVPRWIEAP
jgi:hypothetical protein